MTTLTQTLPSTPNFNELEHQVRDAAQHGAESMNSWLSSSWNKFLAILASTYPHQGEGMV